MLLISGRLQDCTVDFQEEFLGSFTSHCSTSFEVLNHCRNAILVDVSFGVGGALYIQNSTVPNLQMLSYAWQRQLKNKQCC